MIARLRSRLAESDGYSLTEMLVVLAILGVVVGALTQLFVSASNAQRDMSNRFEAQQNARLALDKLRREIHCTSAAAKGMRGWVMKGSPDRRLGGWVFDGAAVAARRIAMIGGRGFKRVAPRRPACFGCCRREGRGRAPLSRTSCT